MKQLRLIIVFLFLGLQLSAQDYTWWNELHNWDGVTSWRNYINYSAEYMGPNALPVPEILDGKVPDAASLKLGGEYHFMEGDQTANFFSSINLPFVKGRAALNVEYRPVEFYKTDTLIRDLRVARDRDTRGNSFGDFYIRSLFQLTRDHDFLPDIMLSVGLKTASGTNLGNARHSDAPGYYLDASIGKTWNTGGRIIRSWRPYMDAGFYSYQTNNSELPQNDAFLFGAGWNMQTEKLSIDNQIASYIGYFGTGDQPVVYRFILDRKGDSWLQYRLQAQFGIHDVPYTSIRISAIFVFEKPEIFLGE